MTAAELKMTAMEIDATASALEANIEIVQRNKGRGLECEFAEMRAADEAASLQAYAHALQSQAADPCFYGHWATFPGRKGDPDEHATA